MQYRMRGNTNASIIMRLVSLGTLLRIIARRTILIGPMVYNKAIILIFILFSQAQPVTGQQTNNMGQSNSSELPVRKEVSNRLAISLYISYVQVNNSMLFSICI